MLHKNAVLGDTHYAHAWEYADSTARLAATGFVAADVKKLALQLSDNTLWVLTATTPAWAATAPATSVATDAIWDAAGDLAVGSGANTAAKLAIGTALQVLRTNAGATALEWAAPAGGGGDALVANPLSQFAATSSAQLAGVMSDETGSGALVFGTAPAITGGSHIELTGLSVRSTGTGAFDLAIANSENLTADKTLTFAVGDTSRTLTVGASASVSGANTGDNTVATALISATTTVVVSAATAPTAGQVLTASSSTAASWATPSGGGSSEAYILIRDEKTAGSGSGAFNAGQWQQRTLNTEVVDTGNNAVLTGSAITLQPGTYRVRGRAPGHSVGVHQCRLWNVTDAVAVLYGDNSSTYTLNVTTHSEVSGRFTIASAKDFTLEHRAENSQNTNGFGKELAIVGITEVFASIEFWKEL